MPDEPIPSSVPVLSPEARLTYANPQSGIAAVGFTLLKAGANTITVRFKSGGTYEYTTASCGAHHIAEMRKLAMAGFGLNTYINVHKPGYASKR